MEEQMVQEVVDSPLQDSPMMQQQIRVILLKQRREYLLGKVTELDEEPSLLIEGCMEIVEEDGKPSLIPFPAFSAQRDMFLTSDVVLSILDPSPEVAKLYNDIK